MVANGVELASEWVTILPETAKLTEMLKAFQPPPIHVKIIPEVDKSAIDKTTTVAKKAGEDINKGLADGATKGATAVKKAMEPAKKSITDLTATIDGSTGGFKNWLAGTGKFKERVDAASESTERLNKRFGSLGQQMLVSSGMFMAAGGIYAALKSVVTQGNEFTDMMNQIQGVTQASQGDMTALSQKARELGRDLTLPATSASDAANAMLELVKGGYSVQEAMDAARGSLTLATAANIPAADAARITSTAMHEFNLNAGDSGKIADILANVANKTSGNIADVGYALQQAGSVSNAFNTNIEDTATALGLLANQGVKSSDAGTLIKTMLTQLASPSKPAQAAMKTLGLEVYDATGKFKGLEYVYKSLSEASKTMTQEQYQNATSTLFGTDAVRFASIAAGKGVKDWDDLRGKINESGTAAKVAGARMQGLPGAIEQVKNAFSDVALTIYDMVKGPLTQILTSIAKVVTAFMSWASNNQWLKDHKQVLKDVVVVLGTFVIALGAVKVATLAWAAAQWAYNAAASANPVGVVIAAIVALVAALVLLFKHNKTFHDAVVKGWEVFKNVVAAVWSVIQPILMSLWQNILVPFGNWLKSQWPTIAAVFGAVWGGIVEQVKIVAGVISWWWHNIMVPAWENISAVVQIAWRVMEIIFTTIKIAIQAIGDVVMALWHEYMEPAWKGIKGAIEVVWDFLSPIFDAFKTGMKAVGDIGSAAGSAIKSAWSGVWDVLKIPLHALGSFLAGIPGTVLGVEIPFIADLHNWGTSLQGLASGGTAGRSGGKFFGPGTGRSDDILGLDRSGIPTARVSTGEGVVRADVMSRGGAAIVALLNAGIMGYESGGAVGNFMSSTANYGYQMGGFGNGVFDCSGLVSAMINTAMGRSWNQGPAGGSPRTGTAGEAAWLTSQGFQAGNGPAGSLRVGFYNGGPGGGHTAGTLPDGTNFESNSSKGVVFGSDARGAADSMFTQKYFLPPGPQLPGLGGSPGTMGGSSGTGGGGSSGGSYIVDSKKVREANDKVTDKQSALDRDQQQLTEMKANAKTKQSALDAKQTEIDKDKRELDEAKADAENAQQGTWKPDKSAKGSGSGGSSDSGGNDLGKILADAIKETTGLDGSLFKNPFDFPDVKSGVALLNAFKKPLQNLMFRGGAPMDQAAMDASGYSVAGGDGGGFGGLLAGAGDSLTGMNLQQFGPPNQGQPGGAPSVDASINLQGAQLGVNPDNLTKTLDNKQNIVKRNYPSMVVGR